MAFFRVPRLLSPAFVVRIAASALYLTGPDIKIMAGPPTTLNTARPLILRFLCTYWALDISLFDCTVRYILSSTIPFLKVSRSTLRMAKTQPAPRASKPTKLPRLPKSKVWTSFFTSILLTLSRCQNPQKALNPPSSSFPPRRRPPPKSSLHIRLFALHLHNEARTKIPLRNRQASNGKD